MASGFSQQEMSIKKNYAVIYSTLPMHKTSSELKMDYMENHPFSFKDIHV